MGKPRNVDRPVEKKISIPSSVVTEVDKYLRDPLKDKPVHAGYSQLVTKLLRKWLEENKC